MWPGLFEQVVLSHAPSSCNYILVMLLHLLAHKAPQQQEHDHNNPAHCTPESVGREAADATQSSEELGHPPQPSSTCVFPASPQT